MTSIIQVLDDPKLFAPFFKGLSWNMWRSVLAAAHGIKLTKAERALFQAVAERDPPKKPVREQWYVCGRRAGKDSTSSTNCVQVSARSSSVWRSIANKPRSSSG